MMNMLSIRNYVGSLLIRLGARLTRQVVMVVPEEMGVYVAVAGPLCAEMEKISGVSGEWKKHQVYATLIKQFPAVKKRVLSHAVEMALARASH